MTFSTIDNRELKLWDQRSHTCSKIQGRRCVIETLVFIGGHKTQINLLTDSRMIEELLLDTLDKAGTRATIDRELDCSRYLIAMLDAPAILW